jgi:hypothetical protein
LLACVTGSNKGKTGKEKGDGRAEEKGTRKQVVRGIDVVLLR